MAAKGGCSEEGAVALVKHVIENCKNLEFVGLMTIGIYGFDCSQGPNPDFICLSKVRDDVCRELSMDASQVELSMGMSSDYEHAVSSSDSKLFREN